MATIKDVAARAKVSVATVSHVSNGTRKVAPATIQRVRQAMKELDYHPNAVAQSLRTRKTHAIGAVVSDITNPFFATLVRGAEDAAIEAGYSLIVCNSDESLEKEDRYVRLLRQRRMDGLLISPVGDGSASAVQELPRQRMPFVFVDRQAKEIEADAVLSDNIGGAYQATHYLIEQGHRRIGLILGIEGATTTEERLAGYSQALEEAGIAISKELVVWGGYRTEGGRRATALLMGLDAPPTAIFSTNNLMTIGVFQELFEGRELLTDQISLISFDDLDLAKLDLFPLSTVIQQPYKIGQKAAKLLLDRIEHGIDEPLRVVRVSVELHVRRSVRKLQSRVR